MNNNELKQFIKDTSTRKYSDHNRRLRTELIMKEILKRIEELEKKTSKRPRGRPRKKRAKTNDT